MILRLALRSLLAHPIRSLVLACGFGLGVSVMATLLGIGEVILDQARSPALVGGGDVVIIGATGKVPFASWLLSSALRADSFNRRVTIASPSARATLYLVRNGRTVAVRTKGGVPSLERALGDPETSAVASWIDTPADEAWLSPDPADALRALDRFHEIPDVPLRADSWAEWLYFNGRSGENRFYLTFFVGPRRSTGKRAAGVRLQLDRGGRLSSYSESREVDEAEILAAAPNLTIGASHVALEGMRYQVTLDLPADRQAGNNGPTAAGRGSRVRGSLIIEASLGRTLPPLTIHGTSGWLSGYVVPVMSGTLTGTLRVGGDAVAFDGGTGYHDHNWGFWKDVSWQWGQVQQGELSLVYGRVRPPADAADPARIPGFLAALGPGGPVGYSTNVTIEETNDPVTGRPRTIVVRGRSSALDLTMELTIEDAVVTRTATGLFGGGMDFLQLRASYRVRGRVGGRSIDFTTEGAAETFRSQH
jgi:hypothetical protein